MVQIGQTPEEREEALQEKLSDLTALEKEEEAQMVAMATGFPYIDLREFPIEQRAVVLFERQDAEELGAVPFMREDGGVVRVGLFVPEEPEIQEVVAEILDKQGFTPDFFTISEASLERALKMYDVIVQAQDNDDDVMVTDEGLERAEKEVESLEALKSKLKTVPVSQVVEIIMAGALASGASDIHMEPEEEVVHLRYRIDGVLNDVAELSLEAYPQIVSRIKLQSELKINVSDKPQDGRFSVRVRGEAVDIRISVLPTAYGETIVMRLLGVGTFSFDLAELGLRGKNYEILMEQIQKPNGMVLVTGPTGSGKTTSLYAALSTINTPDKKIITLENPIEYRVDGVSQTQINPRKGLTFASGLRSILRQDPDVLMVGEIRDFETADIAMQAALTGHLVFSTLHTNDSSGVIPRLIDLGLRPFTIAPALNAVVAQRLVRKLDDRFKKTYTPSDEEIAYLKEKMGDLFPDEGVKELYRPEGEEGHFGGGYLGRIGVYEVFEVTREVETLVNDRASSLEIFEHVVKEQGMITMLQDALVRVVEGETSLEEVRRVLD